MAFTTLPNPLTHHSICLPTTGVLHVTPKQHTMRCVGHVMASTAGTVPYVVAFGYRILGQNIAFCKENTRCVDHIQLHKALENAPR